MQKIVIDTNVLVSALIVKGFPSRIVNELILGEKVSLCLSKEVWKEYVEVLNRERFSKYHRVNCKNIAKPTVLW